VYALCATYYRIIAKRNTVDGFGIMLCDTVSWRARSPRPANRKRRHITAGYPQRYHEPQFRTWTDSCRSTGAGVDVLKSRLIQALQSKHTEHLLTHSKIKDLTPHRE